MDLPATLTPRDNPLDVILDYLLHPRPHEGGEAAGGEAVPASRVLLECSRHGFAAIEARDALETW
eukprot:7293270-Alexandrium_andersonii.AAC.1